MFSLGQFSSLLEDSQNNPKWDSSTVADRVATIESHIESLGGWDQAIPSQRKQIENFVSAQVKMYHSELDEEPNQNIFKVTGLPQSSNEDELFQLTDAAKEKLRENPQYIYYRDTANEVLDQNRESQIRQIRGGSTSYLGDKGLRFVQGFAGGLLRTVGATEAAEDLDRFVPENPKYDDDLMAKLAQGGGDMLTTVGVYALGFYTGGTTAALAASLSANTSRRFWEGYDQAIKYSGDKDLAIQNGMAKAPAAFIDVMADKLLVSRFLPGSARHALGAATSTAAKRSAITRILQKYGSNIALGSFSEGTSEVLGDEAAGIGSFAVLGDSEFLVTNEQRADSFVVGSILGGGVGALGSIGQGSEVNQELLDKLKSGDVVKAKEVLDNLKRGQVVKDGEAVDLTSQEVVSPIEDGDLDGTANQFSLLRYLQDTERDFTREASAASEYLDQLAPKRTQFLDDLLSLAQEESIPNFNNSEFNATRRIVDSLALNWMASTGRSLDSFYSKLGRVSAVDFVVDNVTDSATPTPTAKGAQALIPTIGNIIQIARGKGDTTTVFHELFHAFRETDILQDVLGQEQYGRLTNELGVDGNDFSIEQDERLAEEFEKWLGNGGQSNNSIVQTAFNVIKDAFIKVYKTIAELPQTSDVFRQSFEKLFVDSIGVEAFINGKKFNGNVLNNAIKSAKDSSYAIIEARKAAAEKQIAETQSALSEKTPVIPEQQLANKSAEDSAETIKTLSHRFLVNDDFDTFEQERSEARGLSRDRNRKNFQDRPRQRKDRSRIDRKLTRERKGTIRYQQDKSGAFSGTLYHYTNQDFDTFDFTRAGERDQGKFGEGFYLTPNKASSDVPSIYGSNEIPFNVSLESPYIIRETFTPGKSKSEDGGTWPRDDKGNRLTGKELTDFLKSQGHDGVLAYAGDQLNEVVAFDNAKASRASIKYQLSEDNKVPENTVYITEYLPEPGLEDEGSLWAVTFGNFKYNDGFVEPGFENELEEKVNFDRYVKEIKRELGFKGNLEVKQVSNQEYDEITGKSKYGDFKYDEAGKIIHDEDQGSIKYQSTQEEAYIAANELEQQFSRGGSARKNAARYSKELWGSFRDAFETFHSRMARINPLLGDAVKARDAKAISLAGEYYDRSKPFIDAVKKLRRGTVTLNATGNNITLIENPKTAYAALVSALTKQQVDRALYIIDQLGIRKEYDQFREVMNDIHYKLGMAKGDLEVGYIEHYFPREVVDLEGLEAYLNENGIKLKTTLRQALEEAAKKKGVELAIEIEMTTRGVSRLSKEERQAIEEAAPPYELTDIEQVKIINDWILQDVRKATRGIRNIKGRSITQEMFEDGLLEFYGDPLNSLESYFGRAAEYISNQQFLGRAVNPVWIDNEAVTARGHNGTLGFVINKIRDQLTDTQLQEIQRLMFDFGSYKPMSPFWKMLTTLSYGVAMTNPFTAMTALMDVTSPTIFNGPRSVFNSFAPGRTFNRHDFDISYETSEARGTKLDRMVRTLFGLSGFTKLDSIAKLVIMNSRLDALSKQSDQELRQFIETQFDAGLFDPNKITVEKVIDDIRKKKGTNETKLLTMLQVLEFQPVGRGSLTRAQINASGITPIFYTLKSFAIRQLNLITERGISLIYKGLRDGDYKMAQQGASNLLGMTMLLALAGATKDEITELILGRDKEFSENFTDNLLAVFGMNAYILDKVDQNPKDGIIEFMSPAAISVTARGVSDLANGKILDGTFGRLIPFGAGQIFKWRFTDYGETRNADSFMENTRDQYREEVVSLKDELASLRGIERTKEQEKRYSDLLAFNRVRSGVEKSARAEYILGNKSAAQQLVKELEDLSTRPVKDWLKADRERLKNLKKKSVAHPVHSSYISPQ